MKVDRREFAAAVVPAAVLLVLGLGLGAGIAATLSPDERAAVGAVLEARGALLLLAWFVASALLGSAMRHAYRHWVAAQARLAEEARALLAAQVERTLEPAGSAETRALAEVVNAFARQATALRADVAAQVREASRGVEQERSRLAALMAELTQSVVVCNLDGRILLYNNRARLQFRALSTAPTVAGGAELIGLGRSIYAVVDRALVAHALESVQQRLARGAAHPAAQFVTGSRAGQLLRVQMAPVRAIDAGPTDATLAGFVLMLDNITRDFAEESERDRLLHRLTEGSRASLGNLQAALEMLDYPDLDAPTRERFLGVVRDEAQAMARRIQEVSAHSAQTMKLRWPLEEMLGTDLVAAACRRIEAQHACRAAPGEVQADLWLKVDSFSVLQALGHLAGRLVGEYEIKLVQLRLARQGARAALDLVWIGQAMSTETVIGWETEPITVDGQSVALTVRDVVERHDGEFWFERERVRQAAFFRMLLPVAESGEQLDAAQFVHGDSRPEVYDFDLFRVTDQSRELADRRLVELAYTVFDTETTGLDPTGGDRIIQIGATRIVAGKLRREDCFEQLVDPERSIPAAGITIHGITPDMVRGAPSIDAVLPAFHAFAQDTVLVAHNAAFDMRFLELQRDRTGLVFDHPVLDTLLLSAVVHPNQESHRLEALCERLGVTVLGRHTALGDAIVTAEVFIKIVALLAERGIHTLGQARQAAEQTYLARVKY